MRRWIPKAAATAMALGLVAASAAAAGQPPPPEGTQRISFSVQEERQVENDRISMVLSVTDEDEDAAKLAHRIDQTMGWALAKAKAFPAVRVRSGSVQTYPVTEKGRIRRWRGRQELVLESEDTARAADLAGALQERMQLNGLQFSVSPERRRKAEDELIDAALTAMRQRADRIRKDLDASHFVLLEANVSTSGVGGPIPVMRAMAAEAAPPRPSFQAGTSRIEVTVNATIRLH